MAEFAQYTANASESASSESDKIVKLVSSQGETFEITEKIAKQSKLLTTMIDEDANSNEVQDIALPNVNTAILVKVIDFMNHYAVEPLCYIDRPIKSSNMAEVVQEWYAKYLETNQESLYELIVASNYMDIQPLLDLTCAYVAAYLKDKSKEELFAAFGITEDFTPEEEAKIREENKWAEERLW